MQEYTTSVLRRGLSFGEAPRWHEGRLWYSDFYRHGVFSLDPESGEERLEFEAAAQPSGLGWLPDGDLLYVSMTDHLLRRRHDGEDTVFADLSPYCGFWSNDMVVSASGWSYVGDFGFDLDTVLREGGAAALRASPIPTTNLVVLDPSGAIRQVVPDMVFPNGAVLTPDGRTLIVGETLAFRLSAFDVADDGTLGNRRVWAQMDFVATDGMCLDDEGQVWLANALASECLRVREGGEVTAKARTSQRAFACMLGGPARTTLFAMTAPTSDRFEVAELRDGLVEAVEVAVPGAGLP